MKRSVAILGPTPQFVRWAIGQACELRELDCMSLPDHSFRQLRGLREYSQGLSDNRVFEHVCVHAAASVAQLDDCRGFFEDEVLDAHGGADAVLGCCTTCPANSMSESTPGVWAGCYGWLPATSGFSFEATIKRPADLADSDLKTGGSQRFDFLSVMELVIDEDPELKREFASAFPQTTPSWFGVWQESTLSSLQTKTLLRVVELILSDCERGDPIADELANLIQFRDALHRCTTHELTMHVELIPPGDSDGQQWTIAAHCPTCKIRMEEPAGSVEQRCSACGKIGNPHGVRKSKVLGLRPYVKLVGVMGVAKTREFMARYETHRSK